MPLEVTTNNVPRDVLHRWDLTAKESAEFDYLAPDEGTFFRYRGEIYDLGEFSRCPDEREPEANISNSFKGWDGYQSDTYFSGVVVRYVDNCEAVIVGRYYVASEA